MRNVSPWIERTFSFDFPASLFPNLVERVRGGPARLEDAVRHLHEPLLTMRAGSSWSIQENVGHLLDIETLMMMRLDDFESSMPQLRAWDETNSATWQADHNAYPIQPILEAFRMSRSRLVERLSTMDDFYVEQTAFHPRLRRPMRLVDLVFFIAEHDDYHLAKISAIKRVMTA